MRIVVIGAGIAGLACADELAKAGHEVIVFDKGRGPGGRMATRRVDLPLGRLSFDHGAQYFTARDPAFIAEVETWAQAGLVARWHAAGEDAWVGVPGMNAPVRDLADKLAVGFSSHVMSLARDAAGWRVTLQGGSSHGHFEAALVALPAEQATAFLGAHDLTMAAQAMRARSQPCWTMLAAFAGRVPINGDVIRRPRSGVGTLAWAARNGAKPGRASGETWVVQADGTWSGAHIEREPDEIAQILMAALAEFAGAEPLPPVTYLAAHRWRYAMAAGAGLGALWNGGLRLGACGDWLAGPRVELAWLSGRKLAQMVKVAAG
jgi:renalase